MTDSFTITQDDLVEVVLPEPVPFEVVLVDGPRGPQGDPGPQGEVGPPGTTTWNGITDKPAVFAAGATQTDARNAIGAQYAAWRPSATDITDGTAVGRGVLTAADAAAARSAIGAGTSSLAIGTSNSTARAGDWKPAAADITDASATGRSVLTASSASAALTALGAEDASRKGQANGYASLDSGGKVPVSQLPSSIMEYQGTWNASTNTPTLADGTGYTGDVYRVAVAASRNLGSGAIDFQVGDYAIYNGTTWEKADTTDAVATVNGYTGNVTLTKSDVGLGSVGNTADSAKNVLSATKLTTSRNINGVSFDGTADITVADSTKEPAVTAGTTTQYYRGDKTFQALDKSAVGLGNVDNTSDATKNSAVASVTNKDLTSATNTFPTFNQNTTGSAAKLTTARTIQANLASTTAASFDGSANVTPGVTGTLPVANGGTGATTLTGLVKGSGTSALAAATAGTDYVAPGGALGTPSSGTLTSCTGLPLAGLTSGAYASAATASVLAQRDSNAYLAANGFTPTRVSTATANGTTTLTIADAQVQVFTGVATQTVKLPTTGVTAGMSWTIVNNSTGLVNVQSSAGNALSFVPIVGQGLTGVFTAQKDTPTAAADWSCTGVTMGNGAYTAAVHDANGWLFAIGFRPYPTSTATAGATTTLTVASSGTQIFTGSTTQTIVLPSNYVNGYSWTIINNSTGTLTVNASGGATVATLPTLTSATFTAIVNAPTTPAGFQASLVQASGLAAVAATSVPASAGATGVAGQIAYDASYVYICTATNTWKRAAIATW